jgi:hypothetical protein
VVVFSRIHPSSRRFHQIIIQTNAYSVMSLLDTKPQEGSICQMNTEKNTLLPFKPLGKRPKETKTALLRILSYSTPFWIKLFLIFSPGQKENIIRNPNYINVSPMNSLTLPQNNVYKDLYSSHS